MTTCPDLPPVFVAGYPGSVGGACTELWHTLKLWRRRGLDVRLIPTWRADADWKDRCEEIGCTTVEVAEGDRDALAGIAGLAGSTVVSLCNENFLLHAAAFRRLGCRIVWVNCMNWLFTAERRHYARHGPFDAYVFQSQYQRRVLLPQLARYGVKPDQCVNIPGTLDVAEFPFNPRPHAAGEEFFVGRLSRPAPEKYSSNTWRIYGAIPYDRRRARLLGWSSRVEEKLGRPPAWAEVLPPRHESAGVFLRSLHCLLHVTGGSRENWPRCGLEAMAAGVVVVAEDDFGWPEMIEHNVTGLLGRSDAELAYHAARLAYDEPFRLQIALRARHRLENVLAEPERIWNRWRALFHSLAAKSGVAS